jgi:alginate O-acetyltransferase complex protein AlgI
LNGLYIVVGASTKKIRDSVARRLGLGQTALPRRVIQIAITFSLFVFGLIFFRSASVGEAWYVVTHLFHDIGAWGDKQYWKQAFSYQSVGLDDNELRIAFFSILALEAVQAFQSRGSIRAMLAGRHWAVRWTLHLLLVWVILTYGMYVETQPFIYFQF